MYKIIFTNFYEERVKKFLKKHPDLKNQYQKTLQLMELNPQHPSLRLQKFSELYSVSINMQYRIVIDFQIEGETIIPIELQCCKFVITRSSKPTQAQGLEKNQSFTVINA